MLIQNFGSHSKTTQTNSRPAGRGPAGESSSSSPLPESPDTTEISSNPAQVRPSGWLSAMKKTAMVTALAACLAGPLAGTASAQSYCQPFPSHRPVVVQTMPRHHHYNRPSIGISIGPGGIQVQAGVQQHHHHRGWHQPQVVIQQPPVIIQQPPVIIQQQPTVVVVQPAPVVIQRPAGWWGY